LAGLFSVALASLPSQAAPLAQDFSMPKFQNIAPDLGINQVRNMYGPNLADYDGDGRLDLFFTNHLDHPLTLFQQQPSGQVMDVTVSAGLVPISGDMHGAAWGDCDGDGRLDLYIMIGVNHGIGSNPNRLYRQLEGGTFTESAVESGASDPLGRARGVSWVDYDNDGHLDIFLANAVRADDQVSFDKLFRNTGDCTFTNMSGQVGDLAVSNHSHGASWADYDNDGDMDVFVTSSQNQGAGEADLYRNDGGTFNRLSASQSGILNEAATGMAWGDYDNDGDLDLFVARGWSAKASSWPSANRLYRNNADGTFTRAETTAGVAANRNSHHAMWADFDNDGDLDLYVTNSGLYATGNQPNFLYVNQGDSTFQEVAASVGATGVTSTGLSGGGAVGDFNGDGFLDVVITHGLSTSGGSGPRELLLNQGNQAHWLRIKLIGEQSNSLGIGARVELITPDGLYQMREMNGGTHCFSQNEMWLHFGLGHATQADTITVTWPSGLKQTIHNVPASQLLTINEAQLPTLTPDPTATATPSAANIYLPIVIRSEFP